MTTLLVLGIASTASAAGDFPAGAPRYWPMFGGNRNVTVLDGVWNYGFIPFEEHFDSLNPSFVPGPTNTPNSTNVPSCMDVVAGGAPGYLGPRGVALYHTTFDSPANHPVRLQFQACSFYCRVFVNGKEVGEHRAGGYVAFHLDVEESMLQAKNDLYVLADNRWNSTTAPVHTGGDFWHYGGLMRSVELHVLEPNQGNLWRAYVQPSNSDVTDPGQTSAPDSVDITLQMVDTADNGKKVSVDVAFDSGKSTTFSGTVSENGTLVLKSVAVPTPQLWSPSHPNLHTVAVTYNGGTVIERFGLRSFGNKNARLTINGEVIKLVGWNHHTQWPVTAASPTDDQIASDVALLKKGNANYVRGAHYPHDPRWMDALDEAGIVFWSETIGPSVSSENTKDPYFMKYQMQQLTEMLDNALNHASVMTWGWFNEGPSNDPTACPAYGMCNDYARARDPTRFTTWADDKDLGGKCYEHATLISFNNYPGWYNRAGDKTAPLAWNNMADGAQSGTVAGTKGKPFTISETGAGGIFEWDNVTDEKWTLKYQAEIIGGDVDVAISNGNISGLTLWHFYDFKVDNCGSSWPCGHGPGQENNTHCIYDHAPPTTFAELQSEGPPNCTYIEINGRPGGENHKGSLDFWRREKPAFGIVAAKYAKANEI